MAASTGTMVATCAVLEVSSDRNTVMVVIASSSRSGCRPARPRLALPMNSDTPFASMAAASVSPPPKSISTPHGSFTAVSQSMARMPLARSTGIRNSAIAASMAMPASESPASGFTPATTMPLSSGLNIQRKAVTEKTASTIFSPRVRGPSLRYSSSKCCRPPSISPMSERNRTRVTSSQAIGRKMSVNGPPTSSQSKKLTSFWNVCWM